MTTYKLPPSATVYAQIENLRSRGKQFEPMADDLKAIYELNKDEFLDAVKLLNATARDVEEREATGKRDRPHLTAYFNGLSAEERAARIDRLKVWFPDWEIKDEVTKRRPAAQIKHKGVKSDT